ncbi:hypothetical protein GCM10010403_24460 [Glycomyces rutgersensis]|uniref:Addiction module component n=1 Tax=Glycomyces rutgersensis TaxID=58115 RepID=A0ABN3FKH6_9ACTN
MTTKYEDMLARAEAGISVDSSPDTIAYLKARVETERETAKAREERLKGLSADELAALIRPR